MWSGSLYLTFRAINYFVGDPNKLAKNQHVIDFVSAVIVALLPLLVAAGGLTVFTVAATALCVAGYAQAPPGLVWTGRGTLSHIVAPPRERTILLAAIGMLHA